MTNQAWVMEVMDNGNAKVVVTRVSACMHDCKKCGGGCGGGERKMVVEAKNEIGAAVGDLVYIESKNSEFFGKAFLVYLMPLILMVAAYIIFWQNIGLSEGMSVILSFLVLAVYFLCVGMYDKKLEKRGVSLPIIISKKEKDNE